jgi:hypothetical protein
MRRTKMGRRKKKPKNSKGMMPGFDKVWLYNTKDKKLKKKTQKINSKK